MSQPQYLISAVTSNSSGSAVPTKGGVLGWVVWGTFDTSTVTLQYSPDGGTTWIDIDAVTAEAIKVVRLPRGLIRASVSSVGASTSVSAAV